VDVAATHGVFLGGAREKLLSAAIGDVFVTDSIEQRVEDWPTVHVVSVAPLLAQALRRVTSNETSLFATVTGLFRCSRTNLSRTASHSARGISRIVMRPSVSSRRRQVANEPVTGELLDLFERAWLFEQMGGSGHNR
jgi:hypothetical protein